MFKLVRNVGQQCHESGAFDGYCYGMLANGGAPALSAIQDFSLPTRQFFEQFDIFVIDEHRTGTLTAHHQWVLFRNLNPCFGSFSLFEFGFFGKSGHATFLNLSNWRSILLCFDSDSSPRAANCRQWTGGLMPAALSAVGHLIRAPARHTDTADKSVEL